jgi:hypothetical protein
LVQRFFLVCEDVMQSMASQSSSHSFLVAPFCFVFAPYPHHLMVDMTRASNKHCTLCSVRSWALCVPL